MTYIEDLSEEGDIDEGSYVRAIGWLDDVHDFPIGKAPNRNVHLATFQCPVGQIGVRIPECEFNGTPPALVYGRGHGTRIESATTFAVGNALDAYLPN